MAASKEKGVKQKEKPSSRYVAQAENPDEYYQKNPAWNFSTCDTKMWSFDEDNAGQFFWKEILPFLKNIETQKWKEILIGGKKQHHSIDTSKLNPIAQKRLEDLFVEQESIISLHLNGTHRIYGYINEYVFNLLWFDTNHGDNDKCVCRSTKKHT